MLRLDVSRALLSTTLHEGPACLVVLACTLLLTGLTLGGPVAGKPLAIGETIQVTLPPGSRADSLHTFTVSTGVDEVLMVTASSPIFDLELRVARVGSMGSVENAPYVALDPGDAENPLPIRRRVTFPAEAGVTYRLSVQLAERSSCAGDLTVSVLRGRPEALTEEKQVAETDAYWEHVASLGRQANTVECQVQALLRTAQHLHTLQNVEEAEPAIETALSLIGDELTPDHPLMARALVARTLRAQQTLDTTVLGEEREAAFDAMEKDLRKALAIGEEAFGPDAIELHSTLSCLLYVAFGRHGESPSPQAYETALGHAERRAAILVQERGLRDPATLAARYELGDFTYFAGNVQEGRRILEETLQQTSEVLGPNSGLEGAILNDLGYIARFLGSFQAARHYAERGLKLSKVRFGEDSEFTGHGYGRLAQLDSLEGDFQTAMNNIRDGLRIYEEQFGPTHPEALGARLGLADVEIRAGDYASAEEEIQRVADVIIETHGRENALYARALTARSRLRFRQGRLDEALAILDEAFSILGGPETKEGSRFAGLRAEILFEMGHLEEAEAYFRSGLPDESGGDDAASHALWSMVILQNLARVQHAMGKLDEAEANYRRSVDGLRELFGREHPFAADVEANLARLLAERGKVSEALDAALNAEAVGWRHLVFVADGMSEERAFGYAAVRPSASDVALSIIALGAEPDDVARVWDTLIRSRATVLDKVAIKRRMLTAQVAASERFREASERVANLSASPPENITPEEYRRRLEEAMRDRERAEQALMSSASYGARRRADEATLDDVASSLLGTDALVSFVRYEQHRVMRVDHDAAPDKGAADTATTGTTTQNHAQAGAGPAPTRPAYAAFVVRGGRAAPRLIPLGSADRLEALIDDWRRAVSTPPAPGGGDDAIRTTGRALRRAVWDPLNDALHGARRVLIVPDGAINLVSFAALPRDDHGYLVEVEPVLHFLSTERDLIPSRGRPETAEGLLAMGGPAYDATSLFASLAGTEKPASVAGAQSKDEGTGTVTTAAAPNEQHMVAAAGVWKTGDAGVAQAVSEPSTAVTAAPALFRGERSACASFRDLTFEPLPAAAEEAQQVEAIWAATGASSTEGSTLLTGAEATETLFKRRASDNRILHIASHGFFLNERCPSALERRRGIGGLVPAEGRELNAYLMPSSQPIGENPLLLSGLALAGANHRTAAGPDEEDGILTAEEIAAMDLSGVEWAVLSACDTGVGEVRAGEGVFGLRRAFQVAGAGTLIMSLWSVEDEATREWMRELYEGRLLKELSTAEAVREASLSVLNARRQRGESTHPFYWAAFVAAGDWR